MQRRLAQIASGRVELGVSLLECVGAPKLQHPCASETLQAVSAGRRPSMTPLLTQPCVQSNGEECSGAPQG